MKPSANETVRLSSRPLSTTPSRPVGSPSTSTSEQVKTAADAAATDRRIILHLEGLFADNPALISSLLQDPNSHQPAVCAATVLAAARQALATHPESADLHYHAARAAARIGKPNEAADLLERALEINPCHVAASALLSDVCTALNEPQRAVAWARRALLANAAPADAPAMGHNRRGNELFT